MRLLKLSALLLLPLLFLNCASGYRTIEPQKLNYKSKDDAEGVSLSYKYNLLDKKYAKKEQKKDIRLVALKITNNSDSDIVFGQDASLVYENGIEVFVLDQEKTFKDLKQSTASYLFYLLLTPVNLYTTETNNGYTETTNTFPLGLILGPGLAGGNMIAAGSANKKFENDLTVYDIMGATIKKGETIYGLLGIRSDSYDALRIKLTEGTTPTNR